MAFVNCTSEGVVKQALAQALEAGDSGNEFWVTVPHLFFFAKLS